jgi:hypothetical protein
MFILGIIETGYRSTSVTVSAVYGYFAAGQPSSGVTNATDRITFSTGATAANTASNMSTSVRSPAGVTDKTTYGYFAGGSTSTGNTETANADRIVLSTSVTSANTVSNLSAGRHLLVGISDGTTYGYFSGGSTGASVATTDRIVFSTGATSANTVSNLPTPVLSSGSVSDGATYGYAVGGITGTSTVIATAQRITFSTGVYAANTASNLTAIRCNLTGLSDGTTYGYFCGGATAQSAGEVNLTDKILFSSGVTTAQTAANLTSTRARTGAVSDGKTYGYMIGGYTNAVTDVRITADRLTFSSQTTAANTTSNLTTAKGGMANLSDYAL